MKSNVIMPEIRVGTEQDVKVDAGKVPDIEWTSFCAVLLPAIRDYFGLDDVKESEADDK